ncbi:hypothetical protein [Hydrogenophaga sp.]|uniref:hypothetical protein n=1 Tax=Hydrogenophaga sp. TaxID=1904254 RepID=UPI0027261348|nr:hypothetical protein [Hydrogenophaga sp.]MDO9436994.1 hypothetical protein [Hydrogenophaga sp.]
MLNGVVQESANLGRSAGESAEAVALVAEKLAAYGGSLRASMIVMRGSLRASVGLKRGEKIDVSFTRLGSVRVRFVE